MKRQWSNPDGLTAYMPGRCPDPLPSSFEEIYEAVESAFVREFCCEPNDNDTEQLRNIATNFCAQNFKLLDPDKVRICRGSEDVGFAGMSQ